MRQAAYGPDHAQVATDLQALAQAFDLAKRPQDARLRRERIARMASK
jgi:hypothetical protein